MISKSKSAAALVAFSVLSVFSTNAMARCDIIDVIDLVKDGESRTSIRRECGSAVDDAPGCSLTKVMRYAKDRFSEKQISRRCKTASGQQRTRGLQVPAQRRAAPQIARFCTTPLGACPMIVAIPSGSRCHCTMPYGPVFGIAR